MPKPTAGEMIQWTLFACVLIFFYAPILGLVLVSFSSGRVTEFPPPGYTLQWYTGLLHNPRALQSLFTSLGIGVISAFIATVLATCFAFALHGQRGTWIAGVRAVANLPLVTAPLIIGISLLIFLNIIGIKLGYLSVAIAHIVRAFPFAAIIMSTSFLAVKPSLLEAAFDLGASRWSAFRRVIVPAILPGLVASLLVSFTVSFDEISATVFVIGGGVTTVQTFIMEQIEFVITPEMNALTTVILFAMLLMAWGAERVRAKNSL